MPIISLEITISGSPIFKFLKTVTHGYGFREADFLDENNPIRVFLLFPLQIWGTGEFAHIELRQLVSEVVPTLINSDTGERLPLEYMRCLFYIDYALDDVPLTWLRMKSFYRYLPYIRIIFLQEKRRFERRKNFGKKGLPVSLPSDPNLAVVKILKVIFTSDKDAAPSGFTIRLMFAIASHLLVQLVEKETVKAIPLKISLYTINGENDFSLGVKHR